MRKFKSILHERSLNQIQDLEKYINCQNKLISSLKEVIKVKDEIIESQDSQIKILNQILTFKQGGQF